MEERRRSGKLAVILHADVAGSTKMVQKDEDLAHERIQDSFRRFSDTVTQYHGHVRELRGDALLAEFERASDAVPAALAFQADQLDYNTQLNDRIRPIVRVGIAMGEVIIADNTVTGAGVVLAQRVEQLAEPGGLCITGAIHEALPQRMPFAQANLGEQQVKGFDEPVHIYRVGLKPGESIPPPQERDQPEASPKRLGLIVAVAVIVLIVAGGAAYWFKPWVPQEDPASVERMTFPLPDKPSIAVLPFTNMSGDQEQEYFVDGMTEDLITDLSKLSGLFVIARNSVFTYKNKPVKVRQVAQQLGVRYVMEGSVRRVGNQVRINAQLIDATTDGHLWAERYDGSLDNIFALQDQVTEKIVTALAVQLTPKEQVQERQDETDNLEAYDAFLKGWEHYQRRTPAHYDKARAYFERATELDSNYSRAFAALASVFWKSYLEDWWQAFSVNVYHVETPAVLKAKGVRQHGDYMGVYELARGYLKAVMENPTPLAYQVSAQALVWTGKHDEALADIERAIDLDVNNADSYSVLAEVQIFSGMPEKAMAAIKQARTLDPQNEAHHSYLTGLAKFGLGQYERAVVSLERAKELNPELLSFRRTWRFSMCTLRPTCSGVCPFG